MPRRKRLTDEGVAALKPRATRYNHPDPELPCHYIRVQPTGAKSFVAVTRAADGKQRWHTIGKEAVYSIEDARERARRIIKAAREGTAAPDSFEAVAATWREQHVIRKGLRSRSEIDRLLKHLTQEWTGRDFESIKRGDVARLLDKIEKRNGARQADYALAIFRAMANWYAARNDDYVSPVVKGRRRASPTKRARILTDDEISAVWNLAEKSGTFGALVRMLLLTAQRRVKVAQMRWEEISPDGLWTIPRDSREKGNAGQLELPDLALSILRDQIRIGSNPFVFAGRGDSHFGGYSKAKAAFDAKLGLPQWQLHDLRRTSRSLMARAGVRPEIAERVLGHAISGVEGVYDRHRYTEEKAHALRSVADLLAKILRHEGAFNVVPLAR